MRIFLLGAATALLDLRGICGHQSLEAALKRAAFASVFALPRLRDFLHRLQDEANQRHRRYAGSAYLLEPDIKHCVGGLRDLDLASWAAAARFRGARFRELERLGVLRADELEQLEAARDFFGACATGCTAAPVARTTA